jgi:hypothetical protein
MEWMELTAEQLRPPKPAVEDETARSQNALRQAIIGVGLRLKAQADLEAPRVLSRGARVLEWLRRVWGWATKRFVAAPDEFEVLRMWLPSYLAVRRAKTIQELARTAVNPATEPSARQGALQTLETITGRDLLRERNPAEAVQALLHNGT